MLRSNQQQRAYDELFNLRGNMRQQREIDFSINSILTFVFRLLRCTADKLAVRLGKSRFTIKWSILVMLYEKLQ